MNERLLMKEFQKYDYYKYREQRINKLHSFKKLDFVSTKIITLIIEYLFAYKPKIGIYPGSFNPFHIGHASILEEAEKIFDKVIVAIGINPRKEKPTEERIAILRKVLPSHQLALFEGFLHEFAKQKAKRCDITIIRGFRSGYDIDAELINLAFMRDMSDDFKVIFIAPQKQFDHISSSAIREIKTLTSRN